jgi:hypothetical protein
MSDVIATIAQFFRSDEGMERPPSRFASSAVIRVPVLDCWIVPLPRFGSGALAFPRGGPARFLRRRSGA